MGRLVFVTGAAGSGKGHFAEMLTRRHAGRVCHIATTVIADEERARRVALHQQRCLRIGAQWRWHGRCC
ncbi:MAG: bifunctional adenosylcobinamide kinase/adenosylcobinamide-phosphate guanylyltransferase [Anaerolineae bacterium]